jgi:effector-binding domain-containing protein
MFNKYLIITTAHINIERNIEYEKSLKSILEFSNIFDKIFLLECFSKNMNDLEYLKKFNIEIVISDFDNSKPNYGINEFIHIDNFLKKTDYINNDDYIVKITGRYILKTNNFLKQIPFNGNILAKLDGDIWDSFTGNNNRGVHTFYIIFKKEIIHNFISYIENNNLTYTMDPVEWIIKDYMLINNESFYNGELGIETNFSSNGWKIIT